MRENGVFSDKLLTGKDLAEILMGADICDMVVCHVTEFDKKRGMFVSHSLYESDVTYDSEKGFIFICPERVALQKPNSISDEKPKIEWLTDEYDKEHKLTIE